MDEASRNQVRNRSNGVCEYCHIPQRFFSQLFQIEHITAMSHGGEDTINNAAVACRRCNLHKGPNLAGIDPLTEELTRLFHPRHDVWTEHFEQFASGELIGLTNIGRVTVLVLAMTTDRRVELRRAIAAMNLTDE